MKMYKIIRFRFNGDHRTIKRGLTLEEAKAHCQDPKTSGDGWFDGYAEEWFPKGVNSTKHDHMVAYNLNERYTQPYGFVSKFYFTVSLNEKALIDVF